MQIFSSNLRLSPQNCYLPPEKYQKYGHEALALIKVAHSHQVLAKIRLSEDPNLADCCLLDKSVIIPESDWEHFELAAVQASNPSISEDDIKLIKNLKAATTVEVIVVCNQISAVAKLKQNKVVCGQLVKDFLQDIVIRQGCIVFCATAPELRCHCIVFTKTAPSAPFCDALQINQRTNIVVKEIKSQQMFTQTLSLQKASNFDGLFISTQSGKRAHTLSRITQYITDVVNPSQNLSGLEPQKNVLIVGSPGCGKTAMINAIARTCHKVLLTVPCESANITSFSQKFTQIVHEAKAHVKSKEPCIILLKDIHRICIERSDQLTSKSKLVVQQVATLLGELQRISGISVAATTTSPEEIAVSLKKSGCLSQEIEIPMLTEDDREYVFRHLAQNFGLTFSEASGKAVASWTPGYVLADFVSIVRDAINYRQKDKSGSEEECFKKAVSATLPTTLRGTRGLIVTRKTTFADIGGLEKVKKQLQKCVQWQIHHPEAFSRLGIPPTKGILLYGPPGCAKTTLVKALACESNATFLAVSAADLYSPYVGEAEKRLAKLFMQARIGAPSILFIDEIDALVGTKDGDRNHGVQERILATLLMEMDGVGVTIRTSNSLAKAAEGDSITSETQQRSQKVDNQGVIVVGATNRPELIDDALKRPGRFDKLIHIPSPDAAERLAILQKLTSQMSVAVDIDLKVIARRTVRFSGADLKSLCTESALYALTTSGMDVDNVVMADFEHELVNFRPSLSEKDCKLCLTPK